ncbi:membrane hypothetical protein [Candidatus Xenohaliotis californiensis]|uniref:DNA translocase FtsK 4TM region domain-containing protein n=1 Tax=Candidatus Xenohaliotis californiensis TaxID=84677 RepID=A0ABP0EXI8_9RICK|nr:membrane hypothetical protein [Candidatus Xenohaliotis californiensis]
MNTHVKYIKSSLWLATALYLLIIIASYYPNDISLNTTSTITKVYNIGGTFGAYIADIMMQIFGISSIILCLFFFIMAKKTRDNIQISKKKSLLYVILSTTAATSLMPTVYYFNRIDLFAQKGFMGNLMLKIPQSSYMKIIMLTVSVYCIFKAFGHSIKVPNKIKFVKKQKLQIKIQPVETEGNESTNYPLNIFNNEDEKNNFSSINKSIDSTSMEYSKNKTYQNSKINITHESNDEQNSNKDIDSKPNHESNDEQNSNKDIDSKPNHESNDEQNSNKDMMSKIQIKIS